jgi:2-polyprenyl-3-methyl-5-hydroxy-6-metoxy-1,4-benzoquinol methylase
MFSLESFFGEYETETKEVVIRGRRFRFLVPKSIERFVDPGDVFHDFPLWSKIWEASVILADDLAGMVVDSGKRLLEIGCGVGVVGIVASSFGHRVTMTEYNAHALNFARANARMNRSATDSNPEIMELDWNRPQLNGAFDYVVGSEVVYKEKDFNAILNLFRSCLKPGGQVVLAEGVRKTSIEFFRQMQEFFLIKAQKKLVRHEGEEIRILLCRMRLKP